MARRNRADPPYVSWAQQAPPYVGGQHTDRYDAAVQLLEQAEPEYRACSKRAVSLRKRAAFLNASTIVLIAAAGFTVLPENAARWLAAAVAFAAAILAGLTMVFDPSRNSGIVHGRAVRWLELRDDVDRYLRTVNDAPQGPDAALRLDEELSRLQARRRALLNEAA